MRQVFPAERGQLAVLHFKRHVGRSARRVAKAADEARPKITSERTEVMDGSQTRLRSYLASGIKTIVTRLAQPSAVAGA